MRRVITVMLLLFVLVIPAAAQQNRTHTVQPGETLAKIAQKYNVTWTAIANTNKIVNANLIYAGQVLVIPPAGTVGTPPPAASFNYTIKRGDTLSVIADTYGTTVDAILAANTWYVRTRPIYAGQVFVIPTGSTSNPGSGGTGNPNYYSQWYQVRPNDTMFGIASYFRVNVYDLAEINGILNLNMIYSGQYLRIPGR